ncbi:MAG TPA: prephenate dehydrogenase [Candidatus Omnitrophota bacterium]|nr:prephenate dehydrogenase [Candidatus Omnitrophota bacterium]
MKLFKSVAIVGVGMIGGSLALDIKKHKLAQRVVGFSRNRKTITLAKKRGVIDAGSTDLSVISKADCIILAAPVEVIISLGRRLAGIVRKDALIFDVGSTKQEIVAALEKVVPCFVGSHPLAGSEKRGIDNVKRGLFENSVCVVTPTENTDDQSLAKAIRFWNSVGASTICLSPLEHDTIMSLTSHLPHAVAFALIRSIPEEYFELSAGSLRDTTRIAASDEEVWADIFISNQKQLVAALGEFEKNCNILKNIVRRKDKKRLVSFLAEAKRKRTALV